MRLFFCCFFHDLPLMFVVAVNLEASDWEQQNLPPNTMLRNLFEGML